MAALEQADIAGEPEEAVRIGARQVGIEHRVRDGGRRRRSGRPQARNASVMKARMVDGRDAAGGFGDVRHGGLSEEVEPSMMAKSAISEHELQALARHPDATIRRPPFERQHDRHPSRRRPDLAFCRAQPRADPQRAAPGAAGARHGAGDRKRDRRACGAFRGRAARSHLAADRARHVSRCAASRPTATAANLAEPPAAARARRDRPASWPVGARRRHRGDQPDPHRAMGCHRGADGRRRHGCSRRAASSISTDRSRRMAFTPRRATRRSTPTCARTTRNGACATSARSRSSPAATASILPSASKCR